MPTHPVFPTVPEALDWAKTQNWGALILTTSSADAQHYVLEKRQVIVPIHIVEMRVSYLSVIKCNNDLARARHMGINVEQYDPLSAWDKGKWELGFDAWVGGERGEDYGRKPWMLKT